MQCRGLLAEQVSVAQDIGTVARAWPACWRRGGDRAGLGRIGATFAMALDIAATAIAATASLSQLVGAPNEYSPHPIGSILHLAGLALIPGSGLFRCSSVNC